MNITLLPAGSVWTQGMSRADAEKRDRDRVARLKSEVKGDVTWACQVIMPPRLSYTGPYNAATRRVAAALKRSERLAVDKPEIYLNYEATEAEDGVSFFDRAAAHRAAATEVWKQAKRGPAGAYALPRVSFEGTSKHFDAWMMELYGTGTRTLCPSCYLDSKRSVHQPLGMMANWVESMNQVMGLLTERANPYRIRPYVSGQYDGKLGLVPTIALRDQARDYADTGITSVVIWCDIATPRHRDGMLRCMEAFA